MGDSSGFETFQVEEGEDFFEALSEQVANDAQQPTSLRSWMETAERWRILEALRHCRGNRSAAARELRIGRRTLYAKMERLGIGGYAEPRAELAGESESSPTGRNRNQGVSAIRH